MNRRQFVKLSTASLSALPLGIPYFSMATALGKKMSLPEQAAKELLDHFQLAWKNQVSIDKYIVDFLIGNVVIEVFGGYWHTRPGSLERDTNKVNRLRELGYRVIILRQERMHFWWKDLLILSESFQSQTEA